MTIEQQLQKFPEGLVVDPLKDFATNAGLAPAGYGKVRNNYEWDLGRGDTCLAMTASDRISVFDFVLKTPIPRKGEALTILTIFNSLFGPARGFPNHLLLQSNGRIPWYPDDFPDGGAAAADFRRRTIFVRRLNVFPVEMIYRACLGGSVWGDYVKTGSVAGLKLPDGLTKWARMPKPLFTPSTKAPDGEHDENYSVQEYLSLYGYQGLRVMLMVQDVFEKGVIYAREKGFELLDGKFEVSRGDWIDDANVIWPCSIVDEMLNPDACRYTPIESLHEVHKHGGEPLSFDKEATRAYIAELVQKKFDTHPKKLSPKNPDHRSFIDGIDLPQGLVDQTTTRYCDFVKRYTGYSIDSFWPDLLGIYFK